MLNLKTNLKRLFDERADQLRISHPDIWAALGYGGQVPTQQLSVASYYAAKSVSAVASFDDMFKSDDDQSVGMTNLSKGKPEPGEVFLLCALQVQHAAAGGAADSNVKAAAFGLISTVMRNGEIEITQKNRSIIARQSMEPFYAADNVTPVGDTNAVAGTAITYTMTGFGNIGLVELDTPKWIYPDQKIDVLLKMSGATTANDAVRIVLIGVKNVKL